MSVPIIGQADGPTSVFLAGRLGGGWINIFGLLLAYWLVWILYFIKQSGWKSLAHIYVTWQNVK